MNTITLRVIHSVTAIFGLVAMAVIFMTDRAIPPLLTSLIAVATTFALWLLRDTFTAPKYIRMSLESGMLKERQRISQELEKLNLSDTVFDIVHDRAVKPARSPFICRGCLMGYHETLLIRGETCNCECHRPSGVTLNGAPVHVPSVQPMKG